MLKHTRQAALLLLISALTALPQVQYCQDVRTAALDVRQQQHANMGDHSRLLQKRSRVLPGGQVQVGSQHAHRVLLMGGLLALLVSQASLQHLCLLHQGSSQLVAQTGILTTSLLGQSVTYSKPSSMYLYIEHERTAWRC